MEPLRFVKSVNRAIRRGFGWFIWTFPVSGTEVTARYQKELALEEVVEILQRQFAGKYVTYRPPVVFMWPPIWTWDCVIKKDNWTGVRVLIERNIEAGEIKFGLHHYIAFAHERIVSKLLIIQRLMDKVLNRLPSPDRIIIPDGVLPAVYSVLLIMLFILLRLPFMLVKLVFFVVLLVFLIPLFTILGLLMMVNFILNTKSKEIIRNPFFQ